jgi:transcriptional antiterminator NusG
MAKQSSRGKQWYAIHTYSGYEEAVKTSLEQRIDSLEMTDKIFQVLVPKEKKVKIKNGKRTTVEEKVYPGYVLVEMIVDDASWYVVRNTPNVTGFIGVGTTPTALSEQEFQSLQKRMQVEEPKYKIDISVGMPVKVTDGPFKDMDGKISEIDESRGRVKVLVSMFGRETPVDLDFLQVKKI